MITLEIFSDDFTFSCKCGIHFIHSCACLLVIKQLEEQLEKIKILKKITVDNDFE